MSLNGRKVARARGFRHAEELMEPLVPLFALLTAEEAQTFAEACAANGQVWSALLCRTKYLPEFLRLQQSNIRAETLQKLHYQITNDRWFESESAKK